MDKKLKKSCPICRGQEILTLQKSEKRNAFVTSGPEIIVYIGVCACKKCGFIFLNPRMSANEMINYYSRQSRMPRESIPEESPLMRLMNMQVDFIRQDRDINDGDCILEVGCAEAYFLKRISELKNNKVNIFGIEPSKEYFNKAIALNPSGKFYNDILENIDFENEKFDLIIMRHVLEHMQSPVDNLKIIAAILKNNGRVYIEVPNISVPVHSVSNYFHHEHLSYFTLETLTATLARIGLKVVYWQEFMSNPQNSGFDYPVLRVLAVLDSCVEIHNYPDQPGIIWQRHTYANKSFFEQKLSPIIKRIKALYSQGKSLGLFGAGPHTMDLLGKIKLSPAIWKVIFDNNPAKNGKRFQGIPIELPTKHNLSMLDAILVSSNAFEDEIVDQLGKLAPKNLEILTIYQDR